MNAADLLRSDPSLARRKRREKTARVLLLGAALLSLLALAVLLVRMLKEGLPHMGLPFWLNTYSPSGLQTRQAGIVDAVVSTGVVLGLTMVFALPLGTAAGIYLHEYAKSSRVNDWIRATVSNLAGVPSVVYGLLGLAVFVRLWADATGQVPGPTNLAAALTLAVLVLPILIVATEEALKTVPATVRQASLALGSTRWQTIRSHVLPYSLPGILTGQILALSRAAGETAPLLILGIPIYTTILGFAPDDVGTPLQVRAYFLAKRSEDYALDMAAGTIVVLLAATLLLNLVAILVRDRLQRKIQW